MVKLTRAVLLSGVVYGPGTQVDGIATPGEIVSLLAQGFASRSEGDSGSPKPGDDPQTEPSVPEDPQPDEPDEPDEPIGNRIGDGRILDLLVGAGVTTVGEAMAYLADHGKFNDIHGIGPASNREIKAALGIES